MPKTKKPSVSSSSDEGPADRYNPTKKAKVSGTSDAQKSNPELSWKLDGMRFVKITEFRGRQTINIREYYERNGEILPGKKGISLNVMQWKNMCKVIDEINAELEK